MKKVKVLGMIPARLASTRLPEKLLKKIRGLSILNRVYLQCKKSQLLDEVIIVTDDNSILQHCLTFKAEACLSKNTHLSGTDRIAEAIINYTEFDYIINIQGDEPFIDPADIDSLISVLLNSTCDIATLASKQMNLNDFNDASCVKLVTDLDNRAMYFSRSGIPFPRDKENQSYTWKKHIGIYGYKRNALIEIASLKPSELELTEKLEQLRWLENGFRIAVGYTTGNSFGIDTQADLEKAMQFADLHQL